MAKFELHSPYPPAGDQPRAIEALAAGLTVGQKFQTLLGVTGSGKTYTMAHVIARYGRPTLVISHNKTLAAQLYGEFRQFFPKNAVEYFISYYDYYQPEAYVPATDTYIEKDASINDDIDRLRLRATSALLERDDVIVVASVSAIYGLGSPREYRELLLCLRQGEPTSREEILRQLVDIQYERADDDLSRGTFRVRGDVIEVFPAYEEQAVRLEFFSDLIERITKVDPQTGDVIAPLSLAAIYPAKHFLTNHPRLEEAIGGIRAELQERLAELRAQGKFLEAHRLETRTEFDLEMLQEVGYCAGIENYARHLSGRKPGERPACLIDYFPDDFLLIVDESHMTVPQLQGMYESDRSRKETLVEHGFRLPSALDNRPQRFDEFESLVHRAVFVSATPGEYELRRSEGVVVEQLNRPTGLLDPEIEIRPIEHQVDDLLEEVRQRVAEGEKILVTTLTKRMAEDLAEYLAQTAVRVRYLHSDIDAIERVEIIRDLRLGHFDVLVGINLLREGLDLPEVSVVAILDADKEGFLRSETALIQTAGRAARNVKGKVIMYAAELTGSMHRAIQETERRRTVQKAFNREHGITPRSVVKSPEEVLRTTSVADSRRGRRVAEPPAAYIPPEGLDGPHLAVHLEEAMKAAAESWNFERAAILRDLLLDLKVQLEGEGIDRVHPVGSSEGR